MLDLFPHAQPLEGFIGGIMIGLAAAILLLGARRIAGVSGLLARTAGLSGGGSSRIEAGLFIGGLVFGAAVFAWIAGPVEAEFPPWFLILAVGGLLVGFGTRLGSGCTSGHGVCGMSRLSPRSLAATATFIAAGVVTVAIANALGLGW